MFLPNECFIWLYTYSQLHDVFAPRLSKTEVNSNKKHLRSYITQFGGTDDKQILVL